MDYDKFINQKSQLGGRHGFEPVFMPDQAFDFQRNLIEWATRLGRSAIFADCGLGKTLMQLVWAQNVIIHTNRPVLVLTPLAVGRQTVKEALKFGMEAVQSRDGNHRGRAQIVVTNYERLHYFSPADFSGVVCDESSILKNPDGVTKAAVTEFMRKMPYRLLCTATAAPNDYIELGTSSEALGHLGFMDMIGMFFRKSEKTKSRGEENRAGLYRFRGHAERDFWRWVCSWARAVRKPSDLGFSDQDFSLPALITREHVVSAKTRNPDMLIDLPAITLQEQREERGRTLNERCEMAASLICAHKSPAVAWSHLNPEGNLLRRLIPGAVEICGADSEEEKEEALEAFAQGEIRVIVTKPTIAGFGLNWQHCAHSTFFPSHSYEQWYQSIRRFWRFGQKSDVTIDMVCSEGEMGVLKNLKRKVQQSEQMFAMLTKLMSDQLSVNKNRSINKEREKPSWM